MGSGPLGDDGEIVQFAADVINAWLPSLDFPTSLMNFCIAELRDDMLHRMAYSASCGKTRELGKLYVINYEVMHQICKGAINKEAIWRNCSTNLKTEWIPFVECLI